MLKVLKMSFILIFITVFMVACNNDKVGVGDKSDEQLLIQQGLEKEVAQESEYLSLAKELNSNIHGDSDSNELLYLFKSKKDLMTNESYEKYFNMENIAVMNSFNYEHDVISEETDIYLERLKDGTVNIVIINDLFIKNNLGVYEDLDDPNYEYYVVITNVYGFKDGKLVEFKQYY